MADRAAGAHGLPRAAPVFAALGDPVRLAILAQLSREGPLPTMTLTQRAGDVSRQGITKHLQVLEQAGLVSSSRVGRDRHWQLETRPLAGLREHLQWISAQWDRRLERLRAFVEEQGD